MTSDSAKPGLLALAARTGRQWRRAVDLSLQPFDLTEATWLPLVLLARAAEPMRQKDVAAALTLDKSSVVRVLRGLEEAGLIAARDNAGDHRAKAILITAKGRELAARVDAVARALEHEMLAEVPAAEQEVAARALGRLSTLLEKRLGEREGKT